MSKRYAIPGEVPQAPPPLETGDAKLTRDKQSPKNDILALPTESDFGSPGCGLPSLARAH